ncbi:hypothetical protein INS49_007609 [Diaporthe citri]|uniref:uncharacterized protein n=1 Tax=Diaporthe citri TaxID=83186 RepID=UPI001C7F19C5|nr:uncharacterized protein INS49_007609 [Diaporthe citri]KAG6362517.1 hypothetical protein INS49_007609 [Diaporthe citri]
MGFSVEASVFASTLGAMSAYLCAIAKDDDRKTILTCIKVPCNGRPQQQLIVDAGHMSSYLPVNTGQNGAERDMISNPIFMDEVAHLLTDDQGLPILPWRNSILSCTHEKKHDPCEIMLSGNRHWPNGKGFERTVLFAHAVAPRA